MAWTYTGIHIHGMSIDGHGMAAAWRCIVSGVITVAVSAWHTHLGTLCQLGVWDGEWRRVWHPRYGVEKWIGMVLWFCLLEPLEL